MSEQRARQAALRVGALRLNVAGLDEETAWALGRLVAEGLSSYAPAGSVDRVAVTVSAPPPGESPDALADRIIARVRAEADRLSGGPR